MILSQRSNLVEFIFSGFNSTASLSVVGSSCLEGPGRKGGNLHYRRCIYHEEIRGEHLHKFVNGTTTASMAKRVSIR